MKTKVRVLVIEDQEDLAEDARREIEDFFENHESIEVTVKVENDFRTGYERVRDGQSDVVVLDVQRDAPGAVEDDNIAGHNVYLDIKKAKFSPVVFWTAHPGKVEHESLPPLVTVLTKEEIVKLPTAIEIAVTSGAVYAINNIEEQVATVLRDHMWTEVAPNWTEYTQETDSADVAQVLISRLARVFEEDQEKSFTSHPSHRYVYPPASDRHAPGDILMSSDQEWWVTLTPACDFAQSKVGFVLMAHATPLENHPKYLAWKEEYDKDSNKVEAKRGKGTWNALRQDVLASTRGRFHFLPKFRMIPDLVIDLEDVRSEEQRNLAAYKPIASLASPFAESLLVQNSHHRGRVGVPEIDLISVKARLVENAVTLGS